MFDKTANSSSITDLERHAREIAGPKFSAAFGDIVTVLMRTAGTQRLSLAEVERLVLPAMVSGQFLVVGAQHKGSSVNMPVAVVLWARVSDEIDARLASGAATTGALTAADWTSGENLWLVEAAGQTALVQEGLRRLMSTDWAGRQIKYRTRGPNGETRVLQSGDVAANTNAG